MTDKPFENVEKPSPIRDEASAAFFDGAAQGKLMLKYCKTCQRYEPPGASECEKCMHTLEWRESSGKGTVFNWTIIYQLSHPGFAADLPYAVGVVKLTEGPRYITRFVGIEPHELKIGLSVTVQFSPCSNGEYLPQFTK